MTYKIQGKGNASNKRARHGCEKYWNKYDEPFIRMLSGKFRTSKKWLNRKHKPEIEDVSI